MLLIILVFLTVLVHAQNLPPGDGKEIVQQKCGGCHALRVVTSKRASKQQWSSLVDQMISRGADIDDEEIETVVDYLAQSFGPDVPLVDANVPHPVNVNSAPAAKLAQALHLSAKESSAIVSYRKRHGKFKDWHDLSKVPGVDIKKIEANKDSLMF
jgi:competence protein ComEA